LRLPVFLLLLNQTNRALPKFRRISFLCVNCSIFSKNRASEKPGVVHRSTATIDSSPSRGISESPGE
jgi:hypothetical protein